MQVKMYITIALCVFINYNNWIEILYDLYFQGLKYTVEKSQNCDNMGISKFSKTQHWCHVRQGKSYVAQLYARPSLSQHSFSGR